MEHARVATCLQSNHRHTAHVSRACVAIHGVDTSRARSRGAVAGVREAAIRPADRPHPARCACAARSTRPRPHQSRTRSFTLSSRRSPVSRLLGARLLRAEGVLLPAVQTAAAWARVVAVRVRLPGGRVLRGARVQPQVLAATKVPTLTLTLALALALTLTLTTRAGCRQSAGARRTHTSTAAG